jgi:DNA-binding CsgD family transcriptional regulator
VLTEIQPSTSTATVHQATPHWLTDPTLSHALSTCAPDDPLIQHYLTTGDPAPRATEDVAEPRTWRRTLSYTTVSDLLDAHTCLSLPLSATPDSHRGITIPLPRTTAADQERRYADKLQPLLVALDRHLHHLDRWRRQTHLTSPRKTATPSDAAEQLGITPREITILTLIAKASTAGSIARQLGISPRTVHKHLQNLYRKLDTTDRLATVLRAQAVGLLPPVENRTRMEPSPS